MTDQLALRILADMLDQLEDVESVTFKDGDKLTCPYCLKHVAEQHDTCCKESGHAVPGKVASQAIWDYTVIRAREMVRKMRPTNLRAVK